MSSKFISAPSIFMTDEKMPGGIGVELTEEQRKLLCETLIFVRPDANCEMALAGVVNWVNRYRYAVALEGELKPPAGYLVPAERREQLKEIAKLSCELLNLFLNLDSNAEKLLNHALDRSKRPLNAGWIVAAIEELQSASWIALDVTESEVSKGPRAQLEMTTLVVELCRVYETASAKVMIASRGYSAYGMNTVNHKKVFGLRPPTAKGAARRFVEIVLCEVLKLPLKHEALSHDLTVARKILHPKAARRSDRL